MEIIIQNMFNVFAVPCHDMMSSKDSGKMEGLTICLVQPSRKFEFLFVSHCFYVTYVQGQAPQQPMKWNGG